MLSTLAAVLLLAFVSVAVQAAALHREQELVQNKFEPAALLSRQLLSDYVNQETGERGFVITGDPAFLAPYTQGRAAAVADFSRLERLLGDWDAFQTQIRSTRDAGQTWNTVTQPEIAARAAGQVDAATSLVAAGSGKAAFDKLRVQIDRLQTGVDDRTQQARVAQSRATNLLSVILAAAAVAAFVAVALLALGATRRVITPLARLATQLHEVTEDSVHRSIAGTGAAELVQLGRDAETMRARLVAQIEAARRATEGLIQQAPAVVEIRRALQCSWPADQRLGGLDLGGSDRGGPNLGGLDVAGRMVPAEGEIAGDWWEVVTHPDGRLTLLLVDVSGHGPAAALHAVALKAVLVGGLRSGQDAVELIDGAAREVFAQRREMFATAVVVELDHANSRCRWANAGHPPPLLITRDGAVHELLPTGPLINPITSGTRWCSLDFNPGDLVLAFSDGLIESTDAADQVLSNEQLAAAGRSVDSADQAVHAVLALLETHTGRPRHRDDVTVLAARRPVRVDQRPGLFPGAPSPGAGQVSVAPSPGAGQASVAPSPGAGQASVAPSPGAGQTSVAPSPGAGQASVAPGSTRASDPDDRS